MLTQKQFIPVDDLPTCSQILKSKDARVTNMADLIAQVSQHTGKSYPYLYRYTCMSPFSLNGEDHLKTRRMLASYFSSHRINEWKLVLQNLIHDTIQALSSQKQVDLTEDIVTPITSDCTYYALGLNKCGNDEIDTYLNHLLQLTNFNNPLKIRDFSKLEHSAKSLADAIFHRRITSKPSKHNTSKNSNDFYNFLISNYHLSSEDTCAYMSAILAAGVSTKHTLINVLIEILSMPEDRREQLFRNFSADVILEKALYTSGGVESIYRRTENNRIYSLNIAKAAQAEYACPFSSESPPKNRHLAFGSGAHRCIGEGFSREMMIMAIDAFFQHFPRATLIERPISKSYTHSNISKIIIYLNGLPYA